MKLFDLKKKYDETDKPSDILSPLSPFSYKEAYKMLRTNLSFVSMNGKFKKIIITSAVPNEGKSTVAINLAATLAETGSKVILIDCDLRNPSTHRYLRFENKSMKGLTSLLAGTSKLEDGNIFSHHKLKFDFIPAGAIPPNPAELLASPMMNDLLKALEMGYDYIIMDTPPVGVVTDAAALSRFSHGVIMVIRQKFSTKDQVHVAKANLDSVKAKIIGTVLSRYNLEEDGRGNGKYNYYQYNYEGND